MSEFDYDTEPNPYLDPDGTLAERLKRSLALPTNIEVVPTKPLGLTLTQQKALAALKWLVNPRARGAGRSFVLAHALIQTAIENPGRPVTVFDHTVSEGAYAYVYYVWHSVEELVRTYYNTYRFEFHLSTKTIVCLGKK